MYELFIMKVLWVGEVILIVWCFDDIRDEVVVLSLFYFLVYDCLVLFLIDVYFYIFCFYRVFRYVFSRGDRLFFMCVNFVVLIWVSCFCK